MQLGSDLIEFVKATIALFIIVDPLGNVPVFVGLTKDMDRSERKRAFDTAVVVGSILLLLFALAGQQLLLLFNIKLESFMIAGGFLLLFLSMRILMGGGEVVTTSSDVGVFPIAFPLLAGPGAITTVMITLRSSGVLLSIASIATVMLLTWVLLRSIDGIYRLLGKTGSDALARLMAVFIAAIAVEYIVRGIQSYYPPIA